MSKMKKPGGIALMASVAIVAIAGAAIKHFGQSANTASMDEAPTAS